MKKLLCLLIALVLLTAGLTSCGVTVPRPKIKSGEFNFSVTYEYKGETKTVSGVYVCEYDGLSWALDGGYHRSWSGYIKGGEIDDFVDIDVTDAGDKIILVLNLRADYFMDDYNVDLYDGYPEPYIRIDEYTEDGGFRTIYDADDVEEICGAKIISYQYDEPVKNTFKVFGFI